MLQKSVATDRLVVVEDARKEHGAPPPPLVRHELLVVVGLRERLECLQLEADASSVCGHLMECLSRVHLRERLCVRTECLVPARRELRVEEGQQHESERNVQRGARNRREELDLRRRETHGSGYVLTRLPARAAARRATCEHALRIHVLHTASETNTKQANNSRTEEEVEVEGSKRMATAWHCHRTEA